VLRSIFGADPHDTGEIVFNDEPIAAPTPRRMKARGLGYTPENRKEVGLVQVLSSHANLCLASMDRIARRGLISRRREVPFVRRQIADLHISVPDPLLRKAIELNGFEERRHRHVLANLVEAYGIKLAPEPVYEKPKDPEWAFMVTGYSECIDSFFAFGLFKAAKDTGYFPPELVQTFDPVVNEEARHILFFVNWVAWHRRNMPLWRSPYFELKVFAVWLFLIYERMGIASDVSNGQQDNNFTLSGAEQLGSDVDVGELIALCVAENDRRLKPYDNRLKRPRLVPFIARLALKFIGSKKKAA